MKQPDFQKLFFDYFGQVPRKVVYSVRQDSNQRHDLIFLSSLIHDARFKMSKVRLRGNRLTIPMNRDCWELGMVNHDGVAELYVAEAKLTIGRVHSVEWRIPHGLKPEEMELWIGRVSLTPPGNDDTCDFAIEGDDWSCIIRLRDNDIAIRLADQETPYLYSTIEGKKNR
jgi:hypothetical protein